MEKEEKKKVAETLTEQSKWLRVGLLPLKIRPLTLGQIYEMGQYTCELEGLGQNMKKRINVLGEMLSRHDSARVMQKVFLVCAFRSRLMRVLFGWYIKHRLTAKCFKDMLDIVALSMDANFFLTSIIFLQRTTQITEPSQTTAPGQSWEE